MFKCSHCYKSFKWQYSLCRHMKMEHGEEPSEIESEHSEINDEHHACPFCGLLFTSDSTLQDHIRKCPRKPIPTSNIFGVHDEDDEENEDAWVYLIRHCNANIIKSFEERKQEHIAAGESEKKADILTKREFKPVVKLCMKQYANDALLFVLKLKNSRYFEAILENLIHFKKEKKFTWKKAVPAALDRNFDVFSKVLKDEDIGEQVRGEDETMNTDDSEDSEDSMEENDEESEEEAETPIFP